MSATPLPSRHEIYAEMVRVGGARLRLTAVWPVLEGYTSGRLVDREAIDLDKAVAMLALDSKWGTPDPAYVRAALAAALGDSE